VGQSTIGQRMRGRLHLQERDLAQKWFCKIEDFEDSSKDFLKNFYFKACSVLNMFPNQLRFRNIKRWRLCRMFFPLAMQDSFINNNKQGNKCHQLGKREGAWKQTLGELPDCRSFMK
jgi:hypothetical protein